ncbi:MAG: IPT/TIG domain-containing protein, partial [Anaerolineae bacterium]|nr:IPT/TIG domain-containing protein [Anaerolineae bacterium]
MDNKYFMLLISCVISVLLFSSLSGLLDQPDMTTVQAAPLSPLAGPTISGIQPDSTPNDVDTIVNIHGAGFSAVLSGTDVITAPQVFLDNENLVDVGWVNSTSLTVTVPWGLTPQTYTVTVENSDGITSTLPNAFTVTDGFDQFLTGGPYGGTLIELAVQPGSTSSTLYALTFIASTFRSDDTAGQWTAINDADWPLHIAFDAQNPLTLYLSTDNGIFRSPDNGSTWSNITDHFTTTNGCAQFYGAPHPSQAGIIYASMGPCVGIPLAPGEGGVYYSTDYGDTWTVRNTGLSDLGVRVLAVHPVTPSILMAGTFNGDIYTTNNSGISWTLSTQLTGTVSRLYFNPYQPTEAWAMSRTDTNPHEQHPQGFLYRSTDLISWSVMTMSVQPGGPSHAQMTFLPTSTWLA